MKLFNMKLGFFHLIYLFGKDGIINFKVELPKEEYRDNEVIVLPHYKPLHRIDHYTHKQKINNKIKKVKGFPMGFLNLKFNVRITELKNIMFIPILRVDIR